MTNSNEYARKAAHHDPMKLSGALEGAHLQGQDNFIRLSGVNCNHLTSYPLLSLSSTTATKQTNTPYNNPANILIESIGLPGGKCPQESYYEGGNWQERSGFLEFSGELSEDSRDLSESPNQELDFSDSAALKIQEFEKSEYCSQPPVSVSDCLQTDKESQGRFEELYDGGKQNSQV